MKNITLYLQLMGASPIDRHRTSEYLSLDPHWKISNLRPQAPSSPITPPATA